jgi:spermidine synthase
VPKTKCLTVAERERMARNSQNLTNDVLRMDCVPGEGNPCAKRRSEPAGPGTIGDLSTLHRRASPRYRCRRAHRKMGHPSPATSPLTESPPFARERTLPATALLALFVVSGLAGLLYQSIWAHYLGLVLGHAAYAQTLVLAIFMGGMALGAWLAARFGLRLRRLLLAYAVVELAIGVAGLLFHPLFVGYVAFAESTMLPLLGPSGGGAFQWTAAALLILPQCMLLGATFPLLASAWLRQPDADPAHEARVLGGLYFANSIGAAAGALFATFVLLPRIGLPGTVMTAGALNIIVATGAWWLAARAPAAPLPATAEATAPTIALGRVVLLATAASGAFSFVYEIGWIRLLNQALGTTVHSFELMLSAFILGLALGGLAVRRLAARIGDALAWAGWAQVAMGAAALLSLLALANSFAWVGWLMSALARNADGYTLFLLGSGSVAIAVMLPAAFFAGTTLPLFTLAWRRRGADERAIGRIYAANTLGAIVGVLAAVHLLIPLLGVRGALLLAACGDIAIGLWLLAQARRSALLPLLVVLPCLALALVWGRPDPLAQASAVYRTGEATLSGARVLSLVDGKTATVAVVGRGEGLSILSNGKPDASLTALNQPPSGDEATMMMLAALPLALHPDPREVAMIGWGSGLSAHALLGSPAIARLDSIEIEPQMVASARLFGARVARAYDDPRSHLVFDDARTFFASGARRYQVIVSEPSNPWVSGVAGLFTREFYAFLRRQLDDGGLLVQWVQSYELDDALLASMLAALLEVFPDVDVYAPNDSDLIVVGYTGARQLPDARPWDNTALAQELARVGLNGPSDLLFHRLGDATLLRAFIAWQQQAPHSDYLPRVTLEAPRARFAAQHSVVLQDLLGHGLPLLDMLGCRPPQALPPWRWDSGDSTHRQRQWLAQELAAGMRRGRASEALLQKMPAYAAALEALLAVTQGLDASRLPLWTYQIAVIAGASIGPLASDALDGTWIAPWWMDVDTGDDRPLPEETGVVLAALEATARRDAAALLPAAEAVLAIDPSKVSPLLREQMLELGMLAALAQQRDTDALALERRHAALLPVGGQTRQLLSAWARHRIGHCGSS